MCNFAGRINKAKKPGLKRVKIETMYRRSRGNVKVELLSTSTNFSFFFHCRSVWNCYWPSIGLNPEIPFLQEQVSCINLVLSPENSAYSSFNGKETIRSRSIWLHFLFHVYSDKIDQILDDAENTESMVNQILYRTFTYQKAHDKALLPTGAEVTIPFMYWLLETWSEWGKA